MPNTTIRAIRESMRLTQEQFAQAISRAGDELGQPNECARKTVQRWEAGEISYPRLNYVRALEKVTGCAIEELGFDFVPSVGSLSDAMAAHAHDAPAQLHPDARLTEPTRLSPLVMPTLTGIWDSRCTYDSSSRGTRQVDRAYLVLIHHGEEITAHSIAGSSSDGGAVKLRLSVKDRVVTGTWEQTTGPASYYRGQIFHGALQLQVEASGARMAGAWVGFGKDFDVNTGPWELIRREHGTGRAKHYTSPPEDAE